MAWIQTWGPVLGPALAALVAVGGWLFARHRDEENKARDVRLNFLLDAYRKLEKARVPENAQTHWADLESAIADVQLLGTERQIVFANEVARSFGKTNSADLNPLLQELRADLRRQVRLPPVNTPPVFLRFTKN